MKNFYSLKSWLIGKSKWTFGLPRICVIFIPMVYRVGASRGQVVLFDLITEPIFIYVLISVYYLIRVKPKQKKEGNT